MGLPAPSLICPQDLRIVSFTLAGMGILVLISVSMTFVLVPDRAEKHAIQR